MPAAGGEGTVPGLLFDRLTAPECRTTLADSIGRELERLFNTRAPVAAGRLERRPATVMDYGIPDLSLFPAADADARALLARHLARAIERWEPRLRSPAVAVERAPGRADALAALVTGEVVGPEAGAAARVSFELALAAEPAAAARAG